MSETQWEMASGQLVTDAIYKELDAFGAIAARPAFLQSLLLFADWETHLQQLLQDEAHQKKMHSLAASGVVDTAIPSPDLIEIFCQAQIAACCELLMGRSIGEAQFNRAGMKLIAQQLAGPLKDIAPIPPDVSPADYAAEQQDLLDAVYRIQNLDTIRVVQVVRLLGLFSVRSDSVRQLSLAAGNAYSDLFGIHEMPRISLQTAPRTTSGGGVLEFAMMQRQPHNIVLVDHDPVQADQYARFNAEQGGRILALNMDADRVLEELSSKQKDNGFGPRNLVVGNRIDHRMIPDADRFLEQTATLIDQSADLLLTIGAGHELSEFEGRVRCLEAMATCLEASGLQPVLIKLHGQGSLQEQRARPNFGNPEYATYQVLYCKLLRKKLAH